MIFLPQKLDGRITTLLLLVHLVQHQDRHQDRHQDLTVRKIEGHIIILIRMILFNHLMFLLHLHYKLIIRAPTFHLHPSHLSNIIRNNNDQMLDLHGKVIGVQVQPKIKPQRSSTHKTRHLPDQHRKSSAQPRCMYSFVMSDPKKRPG